MSGTLPCREAAEEPGQTRELLSRAAEWLPARALGAGGARGHSLWFSDCGTKGPLSLTSFRVHKLKAFVLSRTGG